MKTIMFVFGALILCSSSFAAQKLSFEQVKEACEKPSSFQKQIKPANMEITCTDVQSRWIPTEAGNYTLPRARKVTMGMTSDKYDVPGVSRDVAIEQQGGACPRFKETIEKIQTTRSTTCEEILAYNGSEIQFCTGVIDELRNSNPGAIIITDSGRVVQICSPGMANPSVPTPAPIPAPSGP